MSRPYKIAAIASMKEYQNNYYSCKFRNRAIRGKKSQKQNVPTLGREIS